ncbi:MAG TPA: hypothetical protein VJZ00_20360 [Thermoanaerobaculia bacterium]|nr:hypothetical protein [Thermoanaerobaculia bacterium]
MHDDSFFSALIGDGRPLLIFFSLVLIVCGIFAGFQAATGHFMPHDTAYLGMTAQQLCALHGCRIVHFMIHDRISFAGVLVAIGTMYLWLVMFPMREREPWAWWTILLSGAAGFLSFLAYLGYGYLDTWHGLSTLALAPIFIAGLVLTRPPRGAWLRAGEPMNAARACLLLASLGIVGAGLTIMTVGMTAVFVPQDLEFMRVDVASIRAISDRLVPLIAHDRAGFGGGLASCGIAMLLTIWCSPMRRSLWQALAVAGASGFITAIGVHPAIGYLSATHLAPAVMGALLFTTGLVLQLNLFARRLV